jgi:hypothetical protein
MLSMLQTAFTVSTVPSDVCIPIASKLLKEGVEFEVQTQVTVNQLLALYLTSFI